MERRRFGYRRVHDMLRTEFPGTNHKKVFRLYRAQGLAVRKRNKGKKYRGERTPLVAATRVNQTWRHDAKCVHDSNLQISVLVFVTVNCVISSYESYLNLFIDSQRAACVTYSRRPYWRDLQRGL